MFEKMLLSDEIASYRKHLVALSRGEEESYRQPQRNVRRDGAEDAAQIAERIRATLALPFFINDKKQLELSASIGVSLFPDHAESACYLLQASDEAMYLAKKSGRNLGP